MAVPPELANMTEENMMDLLKLMRSAIPQSLYSSKPYINSHQQGQEALSRRYLNCSSLHIDGIRIVIRMSMCYYKVEDVKLEVVDNFLVLEAKYEDRKKKRCFVTRGFKRRLCMPMFTNAEDVDAAWSYGWLTIKIRTKKQYNLPGVAPYDPEGHGQPIEKNAKPKKITAVPIRVDW